ncbi:unnamed protein product [Chrysodeixis includens]|uniref:XRRM domain-containing protein n=1 Tax=Chrysodeixis includens TaxID=689277 RepID=A0A9P0C3A4_CHRIL|nr:unnamed protein product [Chrysodeixis includens]
MLEDVENCDLIAPRISEKLVIGEAKEVKYDNAIVENNTTPVINEVFPSPIVQNEIDADLKSNSEQNGRHSPDLCKEKLQQHNVLSIVPSDEGKDFLNAEIDALEDELPISEVVGDDMSDSPNVDFYKRETDSNRSVTSVPTEEATVNDINELIELAVPFASTKPERKMTEENQETNKNTSDEEELKTTPAEVIEMTEENGQETNKNTSDGEELETTPAEVIVSQSLTNNGPEESPEKVSTEKEELVITSPAENETVKKESQAMNLEEEILTEHSKNSTTDTNTSKRKLSTSSNDNVEEIESSSSDSEDNEESSSDEEDDEDSATEKEDCKCAASQAGKKETESDESETESSSSEDDNSSLANRVMRGKLYFTHYQQQKKKEFYTMYPLGKVMLPRGFLLYFCASTRREIVNLKREHIRDALVALGAKIAFLDYQKGDLFGWVRFEEGCRAEKILAKIPDGVLLIKTVYMEFKKVSKKEETRYLTGAGKEMVKLRVEKSGLHKKLKKLEIEKKKLALELKQNRRRLRKQNQS